MNMVIVHLLASPFLGGIERQVLGLASTLPESYRTVFLSFAERGLARPFLAQARHDGFEAVELKQNAPRWRLAAQEVACHLRRVGAAVLCCSGYKSDLIGWLAARRLGIPAVCISHGWTAATFRVRINEAADRLVMRCMDRIVCVSEGQAVKVRRSGIPEGRIEVIRNAIRASAFDRPDPAYRALLQGLFPVPPRIVVGGAGRFSPEKGYGQLVEAAALVTRSDPGIGFVLFGDGPLRHDIVRQIAALGLERRCVLAGFRTDLDRFLPHLSMLAQSSFTEGLPVVVLEALAAGVPVVATAVGGTPEVIASGETGYLVPPGQPEALAQRILDLARDDAGRQAMGERARKHVRENFTLEAQSLRYQRLFEDLNRKSRARPEGARRTSLMRGPAVVTSGAGTGRIHD
jgi:glycosyltransferase involved in cell wall biosynthesis